MEKEHASNKEAEFLILDGGKRNRQIRHKRFDACQNSKYQGTAHCNIMKEEREEKTTARRRRLLDGEALGFVEEHQERVAPGCQVGLRPNELVDDFGAIGQQALAKGLTIMIKGQKPESRAKNEDD